MSKSCKHPEVELRKHSPLSSLWLRFRSRLQLFFSKRAYIWFFILKSLALTALLAASVELSLTYSVVDDVISPFWLPSGLAAALLLLCGMAYCPVVVAAHAIVLAGHGASWLSILGNCSGSLFEAFTAAFLLGRLLQGSTTFFSIPQVLALIMVAGLSSAISTVSGVTSFLSGGSLNLADFPAAMVTWWAGNALGILLMTPLVLMLVQAKLHWQWRRAAEAAVLALGLVATTWIGFSGSFTIKILVFPFVLWAALRFRQRGGLLAVVTVAVIASACFMLRNQGVAPELLIGKLLHLQAWIFALTISALFVGLAVVDQSGVTAQDHFGELLDGLGFGVALHDMQAGVWVYANPSLSNLLGYEREELLGKTLETFIHPEDHKPTEDFIFNGQRQLLCKDGRTIWTQVSMALLQDKGGSTVCSVTIHDISQHKEAENRAKSSEDKLERFAASPLTGVCYFSPSGQISHANQAFLDMTGYRLEELRQVNLSWHLLTPVEYEVLDREAQSEAMTRITSAVYEKEYICRDGSRVPVLTSIVRLQDPDAFMSLNYDLRIRRKIEADFKAAIKQAEDANRAKSTFLANMSHEIRTPLGAILGFSELLQDSALSTQERESYVKIIRRNGETLSVIINDILDLSKVEAGSMPIERLKVALPEFLSEVETFMRRQAEEKGLSFYFEAEASLPEMIETDPVRLRQILFNLIGNAIKFTSIGSVKVSVVNDPSHSQSPIKFFITDTGIGLDDEQRSRIFLPFSQADSSTTRRFGGTGLGLALSRRLARALGGDVTLVASKPDKGSTFLVTVARVVADSAGEVLILREPSAIPALSTLEKEKPLTGVRVLVVDDIIDNQNLIKRILSAKGAKVELADNGREGVNKALQNDYDLVLMDIHMPVLDGWHATSELRSRGYTRPIVAITAHSLSFERDRCLQAGCNEFLTKPVVPQSLLTVVGRFSRH